MGLLSAVIEQLGETLKRRGELSCRRRSDVSTDQLRLSMWRLESDWGRIAWFPARDRPTRVFPLPPPPTSSLI